jgi:hypothetical protein
MEYKKIHDRIIANALARSKLEGYSEKHHILPKCMGGSDLKSNLVYLTAKEHFIVHALLSRIYPDNNKLQFAFYLMASCGVHSKNKRYFLLIDMKLLN